MENSINKKRKKKDKNQEDPVPAKEKPREPLTHIETFHNLLFNVTLLFIDECKQPNLEVGTSTTGYEWDLLSNPDECEARCKTLCEMITPRKNLKSISAINFPAQYWPLLLKAIEANEGVQIADLCSVTFEADLQPILKNITRRLTQLMLANCFFRPNMEIDLLSGNETITSLTLHNTNEFIPAIKELKALTSLSIQSLTDGLANDLAEALATSRLKSLSLNRCPMSEDGCAVILAALVSSTTLESIQMGENHVTGESIGKFLLRNRSLKSFNLSSNRVRLTLTEIANALKVNTSLTEFGLTGYETDQPCQIALVDALKVNRTLSQLTIEIRGPKALREEFVKSLKHNPALTSLTLTLLKVKDPYVRFAMGYTITNALIDLVKSNEAMRVLVVRLNYHSPFTVLPKIEHLLKKNKEKRNELMRITIRTIKTIILRPNMFGVALPLEVWQIIFSHLRFRAFHNTNFGTLFGHMLSSIK